MRILALDQATKTSGFSIFDENKLVKYGILTVNYKEKSPIERIKQMQSKVEELINKCNPDFVVFENVQFQNNFATFQQLSQLQGAIMALLFKLDIGFYIVEPLAWKSCCGIKGRKREEQKQNTREFVNLQYNINVSEDEADAIGIGVWAIKNIKENANK